MSVSYLIKKYSFGPLRSYTKTVVVAVSLCTIGGIFFFLKSLPSSYSLPAPFQAKEGTLMWKITGPHWQFKEITIPSDRAASREEITIARVVFPLSLSDLWRKKTSFHKMTFEGVRIHSLDKREGEWQVAMPHGQGALQVSEGVGSMVIESPGGWMTRRGRLPLAFSAMETQVRWRVTGLGLQIEVPRFQCHLGGVPLQGTGSVEIPRAKDKMPFWHVQGQMAAASAKQVVAAISQQTSSPWALWLQSALRGGTFPKTSFALSGSFPFSLATAEEALEIRAEMKEVTLAYHKEWPLLHRLSGMLVFHNRSFQLFADEGVFGDLLLQGGQAHIADWQKPLLEVEATLKGEVKRVKQVLPMLGPLPMVGTAPFKVQLTLPLWKQGAPIQATVRSHLEGVSVIAPPPFFKKAQSRQPLQVTIQKYADQAEAHVQYGEGCHLRSLWKRKGTHWEIAGGDLHLGPKKPGEWQKKEAFSIEGVLDTVPWEAWHTFLKEKGGVGSLSGKELLIAVTLKQLPIGGEVFSDVKLEALWDKAKKAWHVRFSNREGKGWGVFPHAPTEAIQLHINKWQGALPSLQSVIALQKTTGSLRSWRIHINGVSWKGHKVLENSYVFLQPSLQGYSLREGRANLPGSLLVFSGEWQRATGEIALRGELTTDNVGRLLSYWQVSNMVRGGIGRVTFQGKGVPFSQRSWRGEAFLDLSQGTLVGVQMGLGKILSLLNVDLMPRRLQGDFRDVAGEGFTFDTLEGELFLNKGRLYSDSIALQGLTANILLSGEADWQTQALRARMTVMPRLMSSLPIAAAVATGNPAVGVAIWFADKLVGNTIQKMHRYDYDIAGTWQSPRLHSFPVLASAWE